MISVMLAISHVVMFSRMAQSSFKTLHKIGFGYIYLLLLNVLFKHRNQYVKFENWRIEEGAKGALPPPPPPPIPLKLVKV